MRGLAVAMAVLMLVVGRAGANDKTATADANKTAAAKAKALRPYAGKLVISPDAPPANSDELPGYLAGNLSKDGSYELLKGPPWPFHVTLVLAAPAKAITLLITDKVDAKAAPLLSVPFTLGGGRKLLLAQAEATIAAGFAANKVYVVRVMLGKKQLAKSELTLRD